MAAVSPPADEVLGGSSRQSEAVASSSKRKRSASVEDGRAAKLGKEEEEEEEASVVEAEAEAAEPLLVKVLPAATYSAKGAYTTFQQPATISTFSYDEGRRLHHDDRSKKYYHPPPPRADLNRGFEELIERDDTVNEHLDSLLLSLVQASESSPTTKESIGKAKLITWRGMMTKLCTLLYEDRQDFAMNAMMVGDTLYLEEHKERASSSKEQERTDLRLKRFGYYGYSFESWTCHAERQQPRDPWDGNVNTNVQWCMIVKTKLGDSLRCILAGEVDAVHPQTGAPIEVKTSMQIRNPRDEERFETKMLRFYMQSFLLGIAIVIVGFRDHRGIVVTHQELPTLTMPRAVRGKAHAWDPSACLKFANELITTIRGYVADQMEKKKGSQQNLPLPLPLAEAEKCEKYPVFRLQFDHQSREVKMTELQPNVILQEVKGGKETGRVGFLLSEYYDMVIKSL